MIYDSIALMLPTYGRSSTYLPRFIDTAIQHWDNQSPISFGFCVNAADRATVEYIMRREWPEGIDYWVITESLPKPNLATYFNMLYEELKRRGDKGAVASMVGDDMIFETHGWNVRLLALINQYKGTGVFWCNDLFIARERCPVNLFVTQDFIEATEHPFMCEEFEGEMIDWLWGKVGKYTRTSHYDPDIHIRHDHDGSKPDKDATTLRLLPSKNQGHAIGKGRARQVAIEIAEILKAKGLTGESVC